VLSFDPARYDFSESDGNISLSVSLAGDLGEFTIQVTTGTDESSAEATAIGSVCILCMLASLRVETHGHAAMCSYSCCDCLIGVLHTSQPSILSPDSETGSVLSSQPFLLEAVTAFFHTQLQHQPIINLLTGAWYQLIAFLIVSLEPSMRLSSYVACS
jgi:hypothetical protein